MRTKIFLRVLVLSSIMLSSPSIGRNQTNYLRDGNWWIQKEEAYKLEYAAGFFDGLELGHKFSYWGIVGNQKKDDDAALRKVNASYHNYTDKYLTNVTNKQLVDGLNTFYSDYRNRRIRTDGAVWLVLNGIAGTSQSELDKMIENWRKNAVETSPQ